MRRNKRSKRNNKRSKRTKIKYGGAHDGSLPAVDDSRRKDLVNTYNPDTIQTQGELDAQQADASDWLDSRPAAAERDRDLEAADARHRAASAGLSDAERAAVIGRMPYQAPPHPIEAVQLPQQLRSDDEGKLWWRNSSPPTSQIIYDDYRFLHLFPGARVITTRAGHVFNNRGKSLASWESGRRGEVVGIVPAVGAMADLKELNRAFKVRLDGDASTTMIKAYDLIGAGTDNDVRANRDNLCIKEPHWCA